MEEDIELDYEAITIDNATLFFDTFLFDEFVDLVLI